MLEHTRSVIRSQYQAALDMLEDTIQRCPEQLWDESGATNRFWQVAFHTLFYLHLYLQPDEASFTPWSKQREQSQFLGRLPWPPHAEPVIGAPYTKAELLEYLAFCRQEIDRQVASLDLQAASGFDWLPFDKLELQIYNIRHVQQHTGELSGFIMNREDVLVGWVGIHAGT